MYNDLRDIHIGQLIGERIRQCGMTYAEFARHLCIDRTTVYGILRAKSIDTERLVKIGKILHYDFLSNVYLSRVHSRQLSVLSVEIDGKIITISRTATIKIDKGGE